MVSRFTQRPSRLGAQGTLAQWRTVRGGRLVSVPLLTSRYPDSTPAGVRAGQHHDGVTAPSTRVSQRLGSLATRNFAAADSLCSEQLLSEARR
eukprot:COSAG04_NODE_171_length_21611_cov_4.302808_4_plen_93_part_00